MELIYFKSLLCLCELGNYSQTADVLGYSQSSISTHIQKLEQIYGGKIICRKGNCLVLTSKGKIIYQYAKKILDLMEKMDNELRIHEVNEINIGTIESIALYYLQDIIEAYKIKYPQITFHLSIEDENILLTKLIQQKLDFILVFNKELAIDGIKVYKVKEENLCFVYHSIANTDSNVLNKLEEQPLLLTGEECPYRKALLADFAEHGQKYHISMSLSNVDTIKRLILNDWGVGFLPQFTIKGDKNLGIIKYKMTSPFYIQLMCYSELEDYMEFQDFVEITMASINDIHKHET
ncbi:LysR family transcriptional regulator [Anaerocolumna sedimenticola]|uniref:LysR family transcriptional regulator n=1 Tax=Anaerocolumna sedimenticola TaxID=2696063 RepID=A0A6P1TJA8_9FIRM|nr:LysR family transcriptional regulator [Anaerocolumna sedimenticola]QHQ60131.1 LysR family transcriptional regulator [Anaerocolumna sedimenticola]